MEELFFMIELFTLKYKRNSDKKIEKTGIAYFRTIDRGEFLQGILEINLENFFNILQRGVKEILRMSYLFQIMIQSIRN